MENNFSNQNSINEEGSTSSNKDEAYSQKNYQKIKDWSMPKIKTKSVYKPEIPFFKSKPNYEIHRVEKDIRVQGSCMDLVIMDSKLINYAKRYHRYMHLGLIQVAVKPLSRLRLDSPILICLRDIRLKRYHDSVLAVLESNLENGPAYFNHFPDYTISLQDAWADKMLVLDIKIPSDKFIEGTFPISIIYRFCFKFMNSSLNLSRALRYSPKDETEVIEVNSKRFSKISKKRVKVNQIEFPEEWLQKRPKAFTSTTS